MLSTVLAMLAAVFAFATVQNGIFKQSKLQATTDMAALAANEALRGLVTGYPCELAKQYMELDMDSVVTCSNVGSETRIIATGTFMGIVLTAEAWASPKSATAL